MFLFVVSFPTPSQRSVPVDSDCELPITIVALVPKALENPAFPMEETAIVPVRISIGPDNVLELLVRLIVPAPCLMNVPNPDSGPAKVWLPVSMTVN